MKRKLALTLLAVVAIAAVVVNATIFAYRVFEGSVNVIEPTGTSDQLASYGAACAGFYSASNGLYYGPGVQALPPAGSNANTTFAASGSNLGVSIVLSGIACSWSDVNGSGTTYLKATASINVTSGTWYFKDILGFGYPAFSTPSPVYLYIKVEDPLESANLTSAVLILYNASDGSQVTSIDIMTPEISSPIILDAGTGLQIDLFLNATGVFTDTFQIGFYVSTAQETPR